MPKGSSKGEGEERNVSRNLESPATLRKILPEWNQWMEMISQEHAIRFLKLSGLAMRRKALFILWAECVSKLDLWRIADFYGELFWENINMHTANEFLGEILGVLFTQSISWQNLRMFFLPPNFVLAHSCQLIFWRNL
ncbi:hypothetical protein HK096_002867, partial [Nowakowskiella sp. JEL0078]